MSEEIKSKKFRLKCKDCNKIIFYSHNYRYKRLVKDLQACYPCIKIKFSEELSKKIIELNASGITGKQMSKILSLDVSRISYFLKKNGILYQWGVKSHPEMVSDSEAKCKFCKQIFPISKFVFVKNNVQYSFDLCQSEKCINRRHYENGRLSTEKRVKNDPFKILIRRYIDLKCKAKKHNIIFTITRDEFINQFNSQNNKCFYSDEEMTTKFIAKATKRGNGDRNCMSVDKIIPEKGYINGNVVFCCNKINVIKNDLSIEEIRKYLHPSFYEKINNYITTFDNI